MILLHTVKTGTMPNHYGSGKKPQHGSGKGKRTGGDPAFANRNVQQLRREAAGLRKQHCLTSKMRRLELIKFIKKHEGK
jgi:hypothetical protein